jgi:hypothetical protein
VEPSSADWERANSALETGLGLALHAAKTVGCEPEVGVVASAPYRPIARFIQFPFIPFTIFFIPKYCLSS